MSQLTLTSHRPFVSGNRERNKIFIRQLSSEYGRQAVIDLWAQLKDSISKKFLQGDLKLSTYERPLKKKALEVLLDRVRAANSKVLQNISAVVLNYWLKTKTLPELQSFAASREAILPHVHELKKSVQRYDACKIRNIQLIEHFENAFTKEVFLSVYQKIPSSRRALIESGCFDLSEHVDELREHCENATRTASIGILPKKEELRDFFKAARVIRYEEGYQGVYFFEGTYQGKTLTLVVKALEKPLQEAFGTKLLSKMHIKTPKMHLVDVGSEQDLPKELVANFQQHPKHLCVMSCIPGTTLEKLSIKDVKKTLSVEPQMFYGVLRDIGHIAACDLLIYNQDRLPIIGTGNLANLMVLKNEDGFLEGAVAIDQAASLSKKQGSLFGANPFKRVETLLSSGTLPIAEDLYEEALSDPVKLLLDKNRAVTALQEGMSKGLFHLMILKSEEMRGISKELPSIPGRDQVDLEAHETMLQTIQKTASQLQF